MADLRLMKIFITVADHLSFTRASEELDIARPSISQAIQQLEEHLNTKLLNRTTRSVSLTPEGELYYDHATSILEQINTMEKKLNENLKLPTGRVRLDASPSIVKNFLKQHIIAFRDQYPDIELLIGSSDENIDFTESAVDCALRIGEIGRDDIIAFPLGKITFGCYTTPEYIQIHGMPHDLASLEEHTAINYFSNDNNRTLYWPFIQNNEIMPINMKHQIAVNDAETCLAFCLEGIGIAVIADFLAQPYVKQGSLRPILKQIPLESRPLNLLYTPIQNHNQKKRLLIDWLKEFKMH